MATITSAQSGNFSATSTWVGGVVPGSADIAVVATTHQVTIDTNVTVQEFQSAGSGEFIINSTRTISGIVRGNASLFNSSQGTLDLQSGANVTLNGNVVGSQTTNGTTAIFIGATNTTLIINGTVTGGNGTDRDAIYVPITSTGTTLTINGTLNGGTGATAYGILWIGSGTVNINGDVVAGTSTSTHAIAIAANAGATTWNITGQVLGSTVSGAGVGMSAASSTSLQTINITGNVTARSSSSISLINASHAITVTGNVTGPTTGTSSMGINAGAPNATVTVTGNVTAGQGSGTNCHGINASGNPMTVTVIGTVTAGPSNSHGISCTSSTTNGVIFQGTLNDHPSGAVAVWTRLFRMTSTNSGITRYANTVGFPNGTLVSRVSPDQVTGMPSPSNVRSGTIYGYNNELTGTCAIPPANAVSAGVPVDTTTGTAVLTTGDVAALIGAQIAAATTTPIVN